MTHSLYALWATFFTRGPEKALEKAGPDPGIPEIIPGMLSALGAPHTLSAVLAACDRPAKGWQALFLGIAWTAARRRDKALAHLETASETESCRAPALVYLARHHLETGRTDLAEDMIREGLALDPDIGEFHLLRARCHNLEDPESPLGLEAALACPIVSPLGPEGLRLEADILRNRTGDAVDRAMALLENGVPFAPRAPLLALGLNTLMACSALDEAEEFLDRELDRLPDPVPDRDPGSDPVPLILLGFKADIAELTGRFRVAALAVSRGLDRQPDHPGFLVRKARLGGTGFSHDQGMAAQERLMELTRDQAPGVQAGYQALAGEIHLDADRLEEALAAFESSLEMDDRCLSALTGCHRVHAIRGRMDRAGQYLEKIRRLSPLKALQLSARGGTDKDLKALGTAAANPAIPPQARAALGLALASALQKKGDHGPAMDHALRANALFRTFIPHDARARAAHNDEIMALMSDRFFSRCRGFGMSGGLPLFILGMPRSGTTLVEQILGGHSRVFAGGELDPIPRMWRRLAAWENRLGSAFRGIPRAVLELTRDQSRQFARKVDQEYRDLIPKDTGADMITDKLPHNFQNIGLIKLLYPRARIIYCRRHPGGIALSNFFTDYKARHGGMGFAYDLEGIGWEIAGCRRLMAHWDRLFPGQIQVVDYETLVKDPQATVRTLLEALGLDWEPGVMDFTRLERPVKTASLKQVRRPLYTGAANRWQHYRQGLAPMFRALEEGLSAGNPDPAPLPDHPPGMFLRAMGRLEAGDLQAAETLFKEILDRYPRHAAAIHMLGAGFARQGKLDLACRNMKRSIELHPGNPTWYDNLANVLEGMGKTEEARAMRETLPRHLAED